MNVTKQDLYSLYEKGILSYLDVHFAIFMAELAAKQDEGLARRYSGGLLLAAALVSRYTRLGHICMDLAAMAGDPICVDMPFCCPDLEAWSRSLDEASVVGRPGQLRPLILDERARLYLYRYWEYQESLARLIRERAITLEKGLNLSLLKEGLGRVFTDEEGGEMNWQKIAAVVALTKRFSVISGGPGTGKTTTISKILALILEQSAAQRLRIALAAPTGKAASRLQEAVRDVKRTIDCPPSILEAVPEEASTIHRLLGTIPGSPYFIHHAGNRLPVDVMVVDESSMVDLPLMSKLVQALPVQSRLILLGDKDQLASVEAGAFLGDICNVSGSGGFSHPLSRIIRQVTGYEIRSPGPEDQRTGLGDCIVQLTRSYRFGSKSGIHAVSQAVNSGKGDLALSLLGEEAFEDIHWGDLPPAHHLSRSLSETVLECYSGYLKREDPVEALESFQEFRFLCALRQGPFGVVALNRIIEKILAGHGLVKPVNPFYEGRPLMITRNDYNLHLFNGDVGVVLRDPGADHDLRVFFLSPHGPPRSFYPGRLPEHETVFAMTVHKSQGSEFERTLLILPDRDAPVLCRELIYTALTRSRRHTEIWGKREVFNAAVSRQTERTSGLRDALWSV